MPASASASRTPSTARLCDTSTISLRTPPTTAGADPAYGSNATAPAAAVLCRRDDAVDEATVPASSLRYWY
ncbi:hypothetical protein PG994_008539 [Apiospora phragmitis]|uniref:Uncharacterized protein n=1 Tax=Apiospora phragmitis TaxID=2905665 RepID=A0ABR1UGR1_9PEZI